MLKSEHLIHRQNGESIVPKQLLVEDHNGAIPLAEELIACFEKAVGKPQKDLDRALSEQEGDNTDYRIQRGLAHLLKNHFSTFEIISPLEPQELRDRVFRQAAHITPTPHNRQLTLEQIATELSEELNRTVVVPDIEQGLYADLQENRILTQFESPAPETLVHRYNLSQVQGILYRATYIEINAHRNVPGQYKLLFRYLKLFQLMAYIEGDADHGFTITIDGPASVFKSSTRYGLALAKMLPALLHVSRWELKVVIEQRDRYSKALKKGRFSLDSNCGLVSHYPPGKPYDSMLEESFAKRWEKEKTDWKLEREVDLIPIPGSVMIPDFRLVHPNGEEYLLEIVGYWRPEYLRRKFYQVRRAQVDNLILAISERLNLDQAGVNFQNVPAKLVWFKDKLSPKAVLAVLAEN
jgi:predicted nuclease of restriction endonuclease-like RecB superfamily